MNCYPGNYYNRRSLGAPRQDPAEELVAPASLSSSTAVTGRGRMEESKSSQESRFDDDGNVGLEIANANPAAVNATIEDSQAPDSQLPPSSPPSSPSPSKKKKRKRRKNKKSKSPNGEEMVGEFAGDEKDSNGAEGSRLATPRGDGGEGYAKPPLDGGGPSHSSRVDVINIDAGDTDAGDRGSVAATESPDRGSRRAASPYPKGRGVRGRPKQTDFANAGGVLGQCSGIGGGGGGGGDYDGDDNSNDETGDGCNVRKRGGGGDGDGDEPGRSGGGGGRKKSSKLPVALDIDIPDELEGEINEVKTPPSGGGQKKENKKKRGGRRLEVEGPRRDGEESGDVPRPPSRRGLTAAAAEGRQKQQQRQRRRLKRTSPSSSFFNQRHGREVAEPLDQALLLQSPEVTVARKPRDGSDPIPRKERFNANGTFNSGVSPKSSNAARLERDRARNRNASASSWPAEWNTSARHGGRSAARIPVPPLLPRHQLRKTEYGRPTVVCGAPGDHQRERQQRRQQQQPPRLKKTSNRGLELGAMEQNAKASSPSAAARAKPRPSSSSQLGHGSVVTSRRREAERDRKKNPGGMVGSHVIELEEAVPGAARSKPKFDGDDEDDDDGREGDAEMDFPAAATAGSPVVLELTSDGDGDDDDDDGVEEEERDDDDGRDGDTAGGKGRADADGRTPPSSSGDVEADTDVDADVSAEVHPVTVADRPSSESSATLSHALEEDEPQRSSSGGSDNSDAERTEVGAGADSEAAKEEEEERPCARTRAKERRSQGWGADADSDANSETEAVAAVAHDVDDDDNAQVDWDSNRDYDGDAIESQAPVTATTAFGSPSLSRDSQRPSSSSSSTTAGIIGSPLVEYAGRALKKASQTVGEGTRAVVEAAGNKLRGRSSSRGRGHPINPPGSSIVGRRSDGGPRDSIEAFSPSPEAKRRGKKRPTPDDDREESSIPPGTWADLRKDNLVSTKRKKNKRDDDRQPGIFDFLHTNESSSSSKSPPIRSRGISPSSFYDKKGREGDRDRRNTNTNNNRKKGASTSKEKVDDAWNYFGTGGRRTTRSSSKKQQAGSSSRHKEDDVIEIVDSDDDDSDGDGDDCYGDDGGSAAVGTLISEQRTLSKQMSEDEQLARAMSKSSFDQHGRGRRRKSPRAVGNRYECEAVRIAVGKRVFSSLCVLQFQPGTKEPFLILEYTKVDRGEASTSSSSSSGGGRTAAPRKVFCSHKIRLEDIAEMRYFVANEDVSDDADAFASASSEGGSPESMSFLSMRIQPTGQNGLEAFKSSYQQDDESDSSGNGSRGRACGPRERRYVVVEARHNDELNEMLSKLRSNQTLGAFLSEGAQLTPGNIGRYAAALVEEDRREKEKRFRSAALSSPAAATASRKSKRLRNKDGKDSSTSDAGESMTHLVYPFAVDSDEVYENAARRLREASGAALDFGEDGAVTWLPSDWRPRADEEGSGSDDGDAVEGSGKGPNQSSEKRGGGGKAKTGRTHYLTIRSEDVERLEPGEFLNDTLIDFWMQWIWRHEDPSTSDVYFFTSHFFTTLLEEGPEAVSSWTAKKGIDIFKKKFIFIPINESLHWSLCVVVNPGYIMNADEHIELESSDTDDADLKWPCILFMDSLKAHRKAKVAAKVRKWLNFEARRLGKFGESNAFTTSTMRVFDPRIPYQDNSWDCGVFVCRYAYALLLLSRRRAITRADVGRNRRLHFQEAITDSAEFDFDMSDIARLRDEMKTLVVNLSEEYRKVKEREEKERRERKQRKREQKKKDWYDKSKKEAAGGSGATDDSEG